MPVRVFTAEQVEEALSDHGWHKTGEKTDTGEFWKHEDGRHLQVPFPPYGGYPDWMLGGIFAPIGIPPPPPLS